MCICFGYLNLFSGPKLWSYLQNLWLIPKTLFPPLVLIVTFWNLSENINFLIEKSISPLFEPLKPSLNHYQHVVTNIIAFAWKAKDFPFADFSPSFTLQFFQNIGEFGANNYFTDHQIASSVIYFFWFILLLNKPQRMGVSQRLLAKCNHLSICISLK